MLNVRVENVETQKIQDIRPDDLNYATKEGVIGSACGKNLASGN